MAVIWDLMLSPGDARKLTLGQRSRDARVQCSSSIAPRPGAPRREPSRPGRRKILNGLSRLSLGAELLDHAPIFRTAGSEPGPARAAGAVLPQPYTTSKMDRDFREVRAAVFGTDEHRQLADMRRSGAVEADAGGYDRHRSFEQNGEHDQRIRSTAEDLHAGQRCVSARVDEARQRGRKAIKEAK